MFLPLEMKKALIGIHEDYKPAVIAALHEAGIMEIAGIRESRSDIAAMLAEEERSPELDRCAKNIQRLSAILDAMREARGIAPVSAKDILFPAPREKIPVQRRTLHDICLDVKKILPETRHALDLQQEIARIRERFGKLRIYRETMGALAPFDIDIGYLGTSGYLDIIPVSVEKPAFEEFAVRLLGAGTGGCTVTSVPSDGMHIAIISVLHEDIDRIRPLLRDPAVSILEYEAAAGTPGEVLGRIESECRDLAAREEEITASLAAIDEKYGKNILSLLEELTIEKERMLTYLHLGRTAKTVVLEGWVAARDTDRLEEICMAAAGGNGFVRFRDPAEGEEIPIEYNNPSWLRPFEVVTTMFSRPRYDEIDPTIFTAPLLIIFFALMLGDAVYGALIVLIGWILRNGAGTFSPPVRDAGTILMVAGGATVVSGILQGGYLGDFLPRFFGIAPPFVLINALESPVRFLQIALVIGVLQINLGLVIAAYQNLRKKQIRSFITDQASWFMIQPAAAIFLFSFFSWAAVPAPVQWAGSALGIAGVALVMQRQGPLGVFHLTGFLGDWLSYARLLALALATGGIAMTVNILTQMVAGDHPLQIVAAMAVFVIGQTFNFVLQTLGAFIHSLRLQFVEFFGKFYQGGGKGFQPFMVRRDVTKLFGDD
ncbi:MAG: V-type ATP synthase subunit I [Methanomicrobiales archaeon]|nr:V-type ATP synthase subunit I [Methanomicrobiales archaeon]